MEETIVEALMILIIYFNYYDFLPLNFQDNVFRLEPHIENGRGKSPYDPKLLTASMLIGEFMTGYTVSLFWVLQQGHIKHGSPENTFCLAL